MASTKQVGADTWVCNNVQSYSPFMEAVKNEWERIGKKQLWKNTVKSLVNKMKTANEPSLKNYLVAATDRQHDTWLRDPLAIKFFNLEMFVQKLDYMHLNSMQPHWLLCNHPAEFRFSSAIFYEQGVDDPIAIGFGILTHFSGVF